MPKFVRQNVKVQLLLVLRGVILCVKLFIISAIMPLRSICSASHVIFLSVMLPPLCCPDCVALVIPVRSVGYASHCELSFFHVNPLMLPSIRLFGVCRSCSSSCPVNLHPVNLHPIKIHPVNRHPVNLHPTKFYPNNLHQLNLHPDKLVYEGVP